MKNIFLLNFFLFSYTASTIAQIHNPYDIIVSDRYYYYKTHYRSEVFYLGKKSFNIYLKEKERMNNLIQEAKDKNSFLLRRKLDPGDVSYKETSGYFSFSDGPNGEKLENVMKARYTFQKKKEEEEAIRQKKEKEEAEKKWFSESEPFTADRFLLKKRLFGQKNLQLLKNEKKIFSKILDQKLSFYFTELETQLHLSSNKAIFIHISNLYTYLRLKKEGKKKFNLINIASLSKYEKQEDQEELPYENIDLPTAKVIPFLEEE